MSVNVDMFGGFERTKPVLLTTTNKTDIAEGYTSFRAVDYLGIASSHSSGERVDVFFYDGTTDFLIWAGTIGANDTEFVPVNIRLWEGEKIKAQAIATTSVITVRPCIVNLPPGIPPQGEGRRGWQSELI